jgi:4-amino-4-deoxy-L-arabinose transferase-like glycosyltransferase
METEARERQRRGAAMAYRPEVSDAPDDQPAARDAKLGMPAEAKTPPWYLAFTLAILLIAAGLRLYQLGSNPPELFEDEISVAISAWKIATTGHDVEKTWVPFLTTRLDMSLPLYGFSTVITQAILGHTTWAIRLPAALFGILSTALIILLARQLGRGQAEALSAGLIFAILPWAVHSSRVGWEPAGMLPCTIGGVLLFWMGLRDRRAVTIFAGTGVLLLGVYAYDSALIIHTLLAALILAFFLPTLRRRDYLTIGLSTAGALVLLLPYIKVVLTEPLYTARANSISVLHGRRAAEALGLGWQHYWEQWDPRWLFLEGPAQLRNQPGMAEAFLWMAPFLVVGLWRAVSRGTKSDWFVVLWLIIGALPAGLTDDGVPHYTRGLLALPPFVLLIATGLRWCGELVQKVPWPPLAPALTAILVVVAVVQFRTAYTFYFTRYPALSASSWYYGTGQAWRSARAAVPAQGTLCVGGMSPFTFPHQAAYYLEPRDFTVLEGLGDARCSRAGTYVLDRAESPLKPAMRLVTVTNDYAGKPLYRLVLITGP